MDHRVRNGWLKTSLLLSVLATFQWAAADMAVVVGINRYPHITKQLKAAKGDATEIAKVLRSKFNFDTSRLLVDEAASRAAILASLKDVALKIKPKENFVFYYAGHGSPDPQALLPSDYDGTSVKGIDKDEIYKLVQEIRNRCNSATVILDCCFSGGLSKDADDTFVSRSFVDPHFKSGHYAVARPDRREFVPQGYDLGPARPVCYFSACLANEQSLEAQVDGQPHGLFTNALIPNLSGPPDTWGGIEHKVNVGIDKLLAQANSDKTHPRLYQQSLITDEYRPVRPFGPKLPGEPDRVVPKNLCDLLERVKPDPSRLELKVEPALSQLQMGQKIVLTAMVNQPGYLLILVSDGATHLYFPKKDDVEAAYCDKAGTKDLRVEGSAGQFFKETGDLKVRGFLFKTKEAAQAVLDAVKTSPKTLEEATGRPLTGFSMKDADVATAADDFHVRRGLVGGYRVTDPGNLYTSIDGVDDKFGNILDDPFFGQGLDTDARRRLAAMAKRPEFRGVLEDEVTFRLNLMLSASPHWADPAWANTPGLDSKLAAKVQKGEPLTQDEAASLLAGLFPKFISKDAPEPVGSTAGSRR